MSLAVTYFGKALQLLLVALLIGAPLDGARADKGGKGGDHKRQTEENGPRKSGTDGKDKKDAKAKDAKKSSRPSEKEQTAKKRPRHETTDKVKPSKTAKQHEFRKQLDRRHEPRHHVRLPVNPFGLAGFLPLQPSFAVPQRAVRSAVPTAAELRRARTREVIIAVSDSLSDGDAAALGSGLTLDLSVQRSLPLLGLKLLRLRVPEGRDVTEAFTNVIDRSATDERILGVQPNYVFETAEAAAVAIATAMPQYATEKIHLGEAHRIALGRNVRVAVIDTELDAFHPELAGVAIERFDAIGVGSGTTEAHGTAIAGIVAARLQIRGIAPDARLLAVRAFAAGSGQRPEATTLSIIDGIHWAIANGARVIT